MWCECNSVAGVIWAAPVDQSIRSFSIIEWTPTKVTENGEVVWEGETQARGAFFSQTRAFIEAVQAGDPNMPRSPYVPSINSLAAVLGANTSAENGGQLLLLDDLVAGTGTGTEK